MISESINKIENKVNATDSLSGEKKKELLDLIHGLENEVKDLSDEHLESAESMAKFMEASTHEALRKDKQSRLAEIAMEGLSTSAQEFETTHPTLTNYVNRICDMLANIGI